MFDKLDYDSILEDTVYRRRGEAGSFVKLAESFYDTYPDAGFGQAELLAALTANDCELLKRFSEQIAELAIAVVAWDIRSGE